MNNSKQGEGLLEEDLEVDLEGNTVDSIKIHRALGARTHLAAYLMSLRSSLEANKEVGEQASLVRVKEGISTFLWK